MKTRLTIALPLLIAGLALPLTRCGNAESRESQCEGILKQAGQSIDSALSKVELTCNSDSDCALAVTDVSCASGCGSRRATNQASLLPLVDAVRSVEGGACAEYEAMGCPAPVALPCAATGTPTAVCNAGRCATGPSDEPQSTNRNETLDARVPPTFAECLDRAAAARSGFEHDMIGVAQCQVDADCERYDAGYADRCWEVCDVGIWGSKTYQAAYRVTATSACAAFPRGDCQPQLALLSCPPAPAVLGARCTDQVCVLDLAY
jgi:hypothetical protein